MPTTRAMARQASSSVSDDKENEVGQALRKKPVRRATTKTATTRGLKAALKTESTTPLSPKKITQVPQAHAEISVSQESTKSTHTNKAAPLMSTSGFIEASVGRCAKNRQLTTAPDCEALLSVPIRQTRAVGSRRGKALPTVSNGSTAQVAAEPEAAAAAAEAAVAVTASSSIVGQDRNDNAANSSYPSTLLATPNRESPRRSLAGTPMENKTISMPAQYSPSPRLHIDPPTISYESQSDDELAGPKTPFRKQPLTRTGQEAKVSTSIKTQHLDDLSQGLTAFNLDRTPRPRTQDTSTTYECPQTTKVPLKPADNSSPRRPMSVSRGSSVAYVFHPLPKASRVHSPITGPYQWPTTPSDDDDTSEDDEGNFRRASLLSSRKSSRSAAGGSQDLAVPRKSIGSIDMRHRVNQLFQSSSDEEAEDDERLTRDYFPRMNRIDKPGSIAAAEFVPEEVSEESEASEESDEESTQVEDSLVADPTVVDEEDSTCDNSDLFTREVDISEDTPQLPSGIFESTPTQVAPTVSRLALLSSPASEDELAGTPTMTRFSRFSSSGLVVTPQARTSLDPQPEETVEGPTRTPKPRPRLSDFQTPHMRFALGGIDDASLISPGAHINQDTIHLERSRCIDPSWLSQTDTMSLSPRKDSKQPHDKGIDTDAKPLPTLESRIVSSQLAPLVSTPRVAAADRDRSLRLSLLLNTDWLIDSSQDDESWVADADTTVVIKSRRSTDLVTDPSPSAEDMEIDRRSPPEEDSILEGSVIHNAVSHKVSFPGSLAVSLFDQEEDTTPHYALPTASSDIRRRSMPAPQLQTPKSNIGRQRMAETAVKQTAVPGHFAKLWLERQGQTTAPSSRRQSMFPATPSASRSQAAPSSLPRATSALSLLSRDSVKSHGNSYIETSTPIAAIVPRPRCYTPTAALTTLKLASAKSTPAPASPTRETISSARKAVLSPRKAYQSPAKTTAGPLREGAFTPHPNAPLRGVVAYVEVFTRSSLPASASFIASLQRLGARVVKSFAENVTHVIWKDGSPTTLAKVRSARREGRDVAIVGSRWVVECDSLGERVPETRDEFAVDLDGLVGSQRRRKSLEPKALAALGGPVLTPGKGRTASGRLSVASEAWAESPMKGPFAGGEDRMPFSDEEDGDDEWFEETPVRATREMQAPGSAPVQKVRREEAEHGRRLTSWEVRL